MLVTTIVLEPLRAVPALIVMVAAEPGPPFTLQVTGPDTAEVRRVIDVTVSTTLAVASAVPAALNWIVVVLLLFPVQLGDVFTL
jgi:hypothetical protein